ncbi:MAG: IS66 family insertion sequence element accessory protein TnpB [Gammaproteobacteria bacterium]|nr:IS66 family insertion sequence element accessory protein TnpB [Gammaproteobacteria bacterium]
MWPSDKKVYLASFAVDMRKSIDGLSILVSSHLEQNPTDGALYVFCNRSRNKIKILYWDRNGFCLWYKRLERQRFHLPKPTEGIYTLEAQQLEWLLSGLDFTCLQGHKRLSYSAFY